MTGRDEAREVLVRDDVDPFIRRLVGYTPDAEEVLLIKLLDVGATSKRKAQKLSELTQHEIELARRLKDQEHLEETEDMGIYLTSLGKTVAKGAKKMYR